MQLIDDLQYPNEQTGHIAVVEGSETLYVIWEVNESDQTVMLVELDRPQDGQHLTYGLNNGMVYLLDPLEVVERVTEWK